MKKFIKEYLRIISFSFIGLVFMIASFYLVINYYHSEEVKTKIYISSDNIYYKNYREKLYSINSNLQTYKDNKTRKYESMNSYLTSCYNVMSQNNTLANITPNSFYNTYDIYMLGARFQSDILNTCWALHLSNIKQSKDKFKDFAPYVTNNVKTITNQTNYAMNELQNNSSYFWTTKVTSSTIRNYLNSDYTVIAESYNDFADIILFLSEAINDGG